MIRKLAWIACAVLSHSLVYAQVPAADKKAEDKKPEVKQEEKKEPQKDPKVADYEKAIKDLPKFDGPFTFYTRKKDILLEIPEDKLGKNFYVEATFNTGIGIFLGAAGFPLNTVDVFRLDKASDEKLNLVHPRTSNRFASNDPQVVAAERAFPEAILGDFRIEQYNPEKKLYLVNITNLFFGDVFRLSEAMPVLLGGAYSQDRDKSGVDKIKSFGDNSIVRMNLHYVAARIPGGGVNIDLLGLGIGGNTLEDSRSAPFKLTYNLYFQKKSDYQPRLGDPRVGFITTDYFSLDKFPQQDRTRRLICRFDLRKKDPKAALSEPVEPIVWVIDNSVPDKYRDAVRRGILFWNKAFEAAGYKDAIVVKDAPTNDPDWDHADTRTNVVRWVLNNATGFAIAVAWLRNDPFTGETVNAAVSLDANWSWFGMTEFDTSAMPSGVAVQTGLQALVRGEEGKKALDRLEGKTPAKIQATFDALQKIGWNRGQVQCSYAEGLKSSAMLGYYAALSSGMNVSKDEYVAQLISDVTCHEVGHCLGLEHNFAGSTMLSTSDLKNDAVIEQKGLTGSVMDYVPVNLQAVLNKGKNYFTPTVGPYDVWAIKYGYSDKMAPTTDGEVQWLQRIASQQGQPGLFYMNDNDADGIDPNVVRYDMAKDPINYARVTIEAARRARQYALTNLPKFGSDYSERNQILLRSLVAGFREGGNITRFVGGVYGNRNHKGDAFERPTLSPVPAATQREAMSLICGKLLSYKTLDLPENVLFTLSQSYETGQGSGYSAPLRDIIGGLQIGLVAQLLNARKMDLISENNYKTERQKGSYTIAEHVTKLTSAVFDELTPASNVTATRRDLQRFTLSALTTIAGAPAGAVNDDARAVCSESIRALRGDIGTALKRPTLDTMTRAHLKDMAATIDRFNARIATAR